MMTTDKLLNWPLAITFQEILDIAAIVISLLSLSVQLFFGVWVVKSVQNSLNNKRVLKDLFIKEIFDLRLMYSTEIMQLRDGSAQPRGILRNLKNVSIQSNALVDKIKSVYDVNTDQLLRFHTDLLNQITESDEYKRSYSGNLQLFTETKSLRELDRFYEVRNSIFIAMIIEINNA